MEDDDDKKIPAEPKHYRMQCLGGHFEMKEKQPVKFPAFGIGQQEEEVPHGVSIQ